MCKGCGMSDMRGYLEYYSSPFENATRNVKEAYTWLNQETHRTKDQQRKEHQASIVKRLKLVAKELSDIRDSL